MSPSCRPANAAGPADSTPADAHCLRTCPDRQRQAPGQWHGLRRDPNVRAAHASVADELGDNEHGRVARNCKADALSPAYRRGVDANHLSCCRDERPTGVAGVERSVGLDDVVDEPSVQAT